jgi:hypothetical protein
VKPPLLRRVLAAALLAMVGVLVTRTTFAKVVINTIDVVASVSDNGRQVVVTGPIAIVPAGENVFLRVTVTQRTTGAIAEGEVRFTGTSSQQQWRVVAHTLGRATFEPGAATAVGLARTTSPRDEATDAHQWLVNITLVALAAP